MPHIAGFENFVADYFRCNHCGFVISKTHKQMPNTSWEKLNTAWHHYYENNQNFRTTNQPPYAEQALALILLSENNIIDIKRTIDFAAGYGTLAHIMRKYFGRKITLHDEYVRADGNGLDYVSKENLGKYKLVLNSAMFEHILERKHLDQINNLVADNGILMVHTVVCENIPKDPNWFYLEPIVHSAFHTNRSMSILMEQWGYGASIYSPSAKSWFLIRDDIKAINKTEQLVKKLNFELQEERFIFMRGFVDYWKGF